MYLGDGEIFQAQIACAKGAEAFCRGLYTWLHGTSSLLFNNGGEIQLKPCELLALERN
jgi:hypothetical protein